MNSLTVILALVGAVAVAGIVLLALDIEGLENELREAKADAYRAQVFASLLCDPAMIADEEATTDDG